MTPTSTERLVSPSTGEASNVAAFKKGNDVDPLIGFLSGVGVSLTGALVASILTRVRDRRKFVAEKRFGVYMKLMDLNGLYFWFTAAETKRGEVPADIRQKCNTLAWQIADMLREADEIEFIDEILDVILGPSFTTAMERYKAISQVLVKLGSRVNPRYMQKIREISEGNEQVLISGGRSNAPGFAIGR